MAPTLFETIPKRISNKRTVLEALANRRWISNIKDALSVGALLDYLQLQEMLSNVVLHKDALSVGALLDYLQLQEMLSNVVLHPDIENKHIFSIAADGKYSAKSAYEGLFS
jgi:hypothetical protein